MAGDESLFLASDDYVAAKEQVTVDDNDVGRLEHLVRPWDNCALEALRDGERSDIEYVRILHLAASAMHGPVERALEGLLESGERFDYITVKALAAPEP